MTTKKRWNLAALGDRIESSRLTWAAIFTTCIIGYVHIIGQWLAVHG